jgi:hypothetical protein
LIKWACPEVYGLSVGGNGQLVKRMKKAFDDAGVTHGDLDV